MKKLLCMTITLLTIGCGGGGGGGGSGGDSGSGASTPSVTDSASSSRLADNPLPESTTILSFKDHDLLLDFSSQALLGDRTFVKVYETGGVVLFLGEVDRSTPIALALHLPADAAELWIEWFTNNTADGLNAERIEL